MGDEQDVFLSPEVPNTQLVCSENTPVDTLDDYDDDESMWGWLYPTQNISFKPLAMQKDEYTFGRSPKCDVVFNDGCVCDNLLQVISKNHFKIFKETLSGIEAIHLMDLSMNGTFVNNNKIGKGNKVILKNKDEIALANLHNKVYVFIDTSFNKHWIPPEMKEIYTVIGPLGSGAYGEVKLAQNKINEKYVAIKKIQKREGKEGKTYNEVRILQNLKHPCVVTMEDVFDTSDSLYIVMEYVSGGELAKRIREVTRLSDGEAKCIFYQLVLALQYLHLKRVAHRDLKPENVLLMSKNQKCNERLVKVSDFGLSKLIDTNTDLKTMCGTPVYTAPEILMTQGTGFYTHQVDVWSLGVMLFLCLSGKLPFSKDRSPLPVVEQIVRVSYSMSGPEWRGVSPQAASLIRRMLKADPNQRITIEQILAHPWLQDKAMKSKVDLLMKDNAPCGDENLYLELQASTLRPAKRRRLGDDDTVLKS
ncbi:serine/threonine-protein kinase Chk2-like [Homalodisca vitripennis]|uniref:serine/threonine-protein kinase Chk2-like n=1 Tax=Homalodisca vitripennis TaxID=197043 RepID=UPI001EEC1833|nr:serine/threonine-protein kinase Chk2-like [Homalodisca vitripennis]